MKSLPLMKLVSLCLFFSSCRIFAGEQVTLYAVHYPPFVIVSDTGVVSGSDVEIVQAAFQSQGVQAKVDVLPWARIIKLMEHGAIAGTLPCSQRPERLAYMIFSDPLTTLQPAAIARKAQPFSDISQLNDLGRYKVVSILGWGVDTQLSQKGIAHTSVLDIRTALANLIFRDVDIFYNTVDSSIAVARTMQVDKQLQVIYLNDIPKLDLHLCLSQRYPESHSLLETFNKGLQQIKDNGIYEAIRSDFN